MMGKFNYEDYRQPWETGPHWELKKEFIETYQDSFEEDRLLCLAQAYANVVLMNCSYPDQVMRQISELAKPLQMRKKFQVDNSSTEVTDSKGGQGTEKIKKSRAAEIYEQTGRAFKQVKFCASKEQHNSEFASSSTNLHQSSSEKSENLSSIITQQATLSQTSTIPYTDAIKVPVLNQQDTELLSSKSVIPSTDEMKKTEPISQIKNYSSLEEEKNNKIISALGIEFIENFVRTMKQMTGKAEHPVVVIHSILAKLGVKDFSFDICADPNSPKNAMLYNAKFLIKNCEVVCAVSCNKKNAKKIAAEAAMNTLFKLSTTYVYSNEEVLQLFSKHIIKQPENESAIVTLKTVASLLDMDDYITFDVVSQEISPSVTEYCCKLFLKDILISVGNDNISNNAKNIAADLGLIKLRNLTEYEIQNNELKKKFNNTFNQTSNLDTLSSRLSQPSMDIYVEKPPFILNRTMYNLSLKDGFVLVEKISNTNVQRNTKTILNESANFNRKTYEYQFEVIAETTTSSKNKHRALLLIGGVVVGTGVAPTKDEAKDLACQKALDDLKKKYYTLRIKEEYVEGFIITRNQIFDGESFSTNVISESNVGCKMLKSMGWTGGGLGGKGIAEPIEATANISLGTGLGFEGSNSSQNSKLFKKRLRAMLEEFSKSENFSELVFSKDFTNEERKEIHQLAGRLHLHSQSRGTGKNRFLTVRQKYEMTKLLKFLVNNGGSNSKFELIDYSVNSNKM